MELGTIKRIKDLRKVWPHEANDFTKWLAEEHNLSVLGEAIEIEMELEETESAVGGFSLDIFAKEVGTGRRVVIENQLEDTNHDHLGKILTYAAGKDAEIIIWVVKRARPEHRKAIEWLNQHIDESTAFFLVEIELWQIEDSKLAPRFNVVEQPNDWAKTVKISEGLTETQSLNLSYWQSFVEFARNDEQYMKHFNLYKPQAQNWYSMWLRGYVISSLNLTVLSWDKLVCAVIYVRKNKDLFNIYKENASDLEMIAGCKPIFSEASIDGRIIFEKKADINNSSKWEEYFRWQIDMAVKLKSIIEKYEKHQ